MEFALGNSGGRVTVDTLSLALDHAFPRVTYASLQLLLHVHRPRTLKHVARFSKWLLVLFKS